MPSFVAAHRHPKRAAGVSVARRIARIGRKIGLALQVRAERRMLMKLDDMALKDMGFDKGVAEGEATRAFWDIPVDRLR